MAIEKVKRKGKTKDALIEKKDQRWHCRNRITLVFGSNDVEELLQHFLVSHQKEWFIIYDKKVWFLGSFDQVCMVFVEDAAFIERHVFSLLRVDPDNWFMIHFAHHPQLDREGGAFVDF